MAPVFDYGAPIWSQCCLTADLEKALNRAYRFFLGVGRKHPLAAAAGDMCWMPTKQRHQLETSSFLRYLLQKGSTKLAEGYLWIVRK